MQPTTYGVVLKRHIAGVVLGCISLGAVANPLSLPIPGILTVPLKLVTGADVSTGPGADVTPVRLYAQIADEDAARLGPAGAKSCSIELEAYGVLASNRVHFKNVGLRCPGAEVLALTGRTQVLDLDRKVGLKSSVIWDSNARALLSVVPDRKEPSKGNMLLRGVASALNGATFGASSVLVPHKDANDAPDPALSTPQSETDTLYPVLTLDPGRELLLLVPAGR